jgi:hypothetical protein
VLQLYSLGAYSHGLIQRLWDNPAVICEAAKAAGDGAQSPGHGFLVEIVVGIERVDTGVS